MTFSRSNARYAAVLPAFDIDADHAAEARHLPRGDRVIGMRRQTRVVDPLDRGMPVEELAPPPCALALCRATRSGSVFSPRLSAYAGCGSMTPPSSRRVLPIGRQQRARSRQHPAGDVAVTVQVLRRALHRQVDAQGERLLVDRAGEGVVDARQHARRAARRRDRANVDAAQRRVDRRLEPHELGLGADDGRRCRRAPRATRSAARRRTRDNRCSIR